MNTSPPPAVFILGCQRSGTTLAYMMLTSHPKIVGLDESELNDELPSKQTSGLLDSQESAKLLCYKLPTKTTELDSIQSQFPESQIIWVMRDPYPCINSMLKLKTQGTSWIEVHGRTELERHIDFLSTVLPLEVFPTNIQTLSPLEVGAYLWKYKMCSYEIYAASILPVHLIRYEDFSTHPYASFAPLLKTLGLAWNDQLLAHHLHHQGKTYSGNNKGSLPLKRKRALESANHFSFDEQHLIQNIIGPKIWKQYLPHLPFSAGYLLPTAPVKTSLSSAPLISIVLPSYNYDWCIGAAIESVITQSYENWELIIVDDGSTDNSLKVIQPFLEVYPEKINLYTHPKNKNRGVIETYKKGLIESQGELITFLECDDQLTTEYLQTKIDLFRSHPEAILIYNDVTLTGDTTTINSMLPHFIRWINQVSEKNTPFDALSYFKENIIIPTFSSVMVRQNIIQNEDFRSDLGPWFDWYLWASVSRRGLFYFCTEKLSIWQRHPASYESQHRKKLEAEKTKILLHLLTKNEVQLMLSQSTTDV